MVKTHLIALLACALLLTSSGCGTVSFRGAFSGSDSIKTESGFVSVVQFTVVFGNGMSSPGTVVTFLFNGNSSTLTFCGDQRSQFPINQFARANFTPGQPCDNLLLVVIGIN